MSKSEKKLKIPCIIFGKKGFKVVTKNPIAIKIRLKFPFLAK